MCWTSLLSVGMTRMTHYLIWFAFGHLVKKEGFAQTWRTFWRKLCLSLQALSAGVWPTHTMEGEPEGRSGEELAGGFWGVIYVQRGDLEFMTKHFALNNVMSVQPCALCRASNRGVPGEIQWTDVNWPPTWADHCLSDEVCGKTWGCALQNPLNCKELSVATANWW